MDTSKEIMMPEVRNTKIIGYFLQECVLDVD